MNTSILLTVIGTVVSVVIGIWGIVLAVRYSRRVRISFIVESCLSLFADVTQGIDGLGVQYKGTPVSRNLVLLRGCLMNTGKRDITPSMMEKPLRLRLPIGYKWIDCRVTKTSKDLKALVASVAPSVVEFDIGMFKINEYFRFEALATVPDEAPAAATLPKGVAKLGLLQVLKFDHRVADATGTEVVALSSLDEPPNAQNWTAMPAVTFETSMIIMGLVGGLLMLALALRKPDPCALAFRVTNQAGDSVVVSAAANGNYVVLQGPHGYRRSLTVCEFDTLSKTPVSAPIQDESGKKTFILMSVMYILAGGGMLAARLNRGARRGRYRRILRDPADSARPPPTS